MASVRSVLSINHLTSLSLPHSRASVHQPRNRALCRRTGAPAVPHGATPAVSRHRNNSRSAHHGAAPQSSGMTAQFSCIVYQTPKQPPIVFGLSSKLEAESMQYVLRGYKGMSASLSSESSQFQFVMHKRRVSHLTSAVECPSAPSHQARPTAFHIRHTPSTTTFLT